MYLSFVARHAGEIPEGFKISAHIVGFKEMARKRHGRRRTSGPRSRKERRMIRRLFKTIIAVLALAFALQGCFWYVGDDGYYHHGHGYGHHGGWRR